MKLDQGSPGLHLDNLRQVSLDFQLALNFHPDGETAVFYSMEINNISMILTNN
jgi:hypothetical protein